MTRWKTSQIALALMVAGIAFFAWKSDQRIFADKGRLDIREEGSAVVFYWNSEVGVPMARRFEEGFDQWKGKTTRFVIDLNSPGGAIAEGRAVIEAIDKIKRTHIIETRVGADAICLSMCVPIYLQGTRRTASATSQWMFHEPARYDAATGRQAKEPEFERQYTARQFFRRYFENSDMNAEWRAELEQEWKGKEVWKTGEELVDEGAGVVQEVY